MKAAAIILAGILTILSHSEMSSAQGQGGWGGNGGSTGSWANANSQPGQPFSRDPQHNSQFSYGYGGVDANGVPYGGSGGDGGFHVHVNDEQGRQHTYSGQGGQGGFGGGPPGQPGQPGYPGTHSYANAGTNRNYDNRYPYSSSSSSSFSSAWSTFYLICLFSLYIFIK